jgi:hypothetical protein
MLFLYLTWKCKLAITNSRSVPDQFAYYIENPLVIISIHSGNFGVTVVLIEIDTWII